MLICIDFPQEYLKRSKSNIDTQPRKCCFFDVNGNCYENARIMSKSDQQTVTRSFVVKPISVFNPEILYLSKFWYCVEKNEQTRQKEILIRKGFISLMDYNPSLRSFQEFDVLRFSEEQTEIQLFS